MHVSWGWLGVWVIATASLAFFVTASIATPPRDTTFAFVVFVLSSSLIVNRIRASRNAYRVSQFAVRNRRRDGAEALSPTEGNRCDD